MAKARVRYKGFSDVREISAKDLKPHGVAVDRDLVFDASNRHTMIIDLNDDLEDILRKEGTFVVSAITDEGEVGEDIVKASAHLDDTAVAATTVDGDTGQTSKGKGKGK